MFINIFFRKRQFWDEKCHFKIKIKDDIKWNVKTEWVNISKISPFLNSLQLKHFPNVRWRQSNSSRPNWHHVTFILWPYYLPTIFGQRCSCLSLRKFMKSLLSMLRCSSASKKNFLVHAGRNRSSVHSHNALRLRCCCLVEMRTLERVVL